MKRGITLKIVGCVWLVGWLLWGLLRLNLPFNMLGRGPFSYYILWTFGMAAMFFLYGVRRARGEEWKSRSAYGVGYFLRWFRKMHYAWLPFIAVVFLLIIGNIFSGPMIHSRSLATQITVPEPVPFIDTEIPPFDPTQIPWVDRAYAEVLGNQRFGELGPVGASMSVGEYMRQEVGGQLFYVAPILHNGFFQYRVRPEGTPGFIMVSMTNDEDVRLITYNPIRVQPNGHAAWGDKLERIVHREAPFALRYGHWFQIDDDLHPFWIVPLIRNQIGLWGGPDVIGVVIVDAVTGQATRYDVHDVPAWVDRVFPESLIEAQIGNWGRFSGGWWNQNSLFGPRTGMVQSDEGNVVVYNNGQVYLFDSLTSYRGADESTIGFLLTNLRTKEVRHYGMVGATEHAAQLAAIGDDQVRAQEYLATFPIPTIIEGQPTYFMTLVDPASRMVRAFALVNIRQHQIVGIGTTIRQAEQNYRMRLHEAGAGGLFTATANMVEVEGYIVRWTPYVRGGNTFFSFIVSGHEDRLFATDTSRSDALITREGDRVRLQVMATDQYRWSVFSFNNLEFDFIMGEIEQIVTDAELELRLEALRENPAVMDDERFRDWWELLTPEQQADFLERATSDD
ncbi:hypothetical protein FWD07_03030 [Candidatus Saccharibacteria bacterium]|nr:hypothetical protein [Candidatus Saccharibacteria bacterium]